MQFSETRNEKPLDPIGIFFHAQRPNLAPEYFSSRTTRQTLKMDASRAGSGGTFDLLSQPWRLLRVDPSATNEQIHDAYAKAQQNPMASPTALAFARNVLLDPNRRLLYELTYPLDFSDIEAYYAALSADNSIEEILNFSDRLWPLARANFIAHIASHRPADEATLYALLESHTAMDAADLYARLKASRAAAGIPAPSLISFNQRLDELLPTHAAAAFAGYLTIQEAVEPVLECTNQILANGERHFIDALGVLLEPYRQGVASMQTDGAERIERACAALRQEPNNASLVEELSNAIPQWTLLSKPLLLLGARQEQFEPDFEKPVEQLRLLIADLTTNEHYDAALTIADISRDIFRAVPTTIEKLAEDARLMARLSQYGNMKHLQDIIDEIEVDSGRLIAALERDGFGLASTEPAKRLWEAFVQAANATSATPWSDVPWQVMRDFAIHLSNQPEAAAAVVSLIKGLIECGGKISSPPTVMRALRDNLNFMKSFMGAEVTLEGPETIFHPTKEPVVSKLIRQFYGLRFGLASNFKRKHVIGLVGLALFGLAALAASYAGFDNLRSIWLKLSVGTPPQQTMPSLTTETNLGAETKPPVGTGQHLALDGVRYCHFQQERLRIVKPDVRGPEDARAYNQLIVDYNSRCSDYFYQDNDLKTVLAEVDAKKDLLAADAKRIVSTWSGHAAEAPPKNWVVQ